MSSLFAAVRRRPREEARSINGLSLGAYMETMLYNGHQYPITGGTLSQTPEEISDDFAGYVGGVMKQNGVVFGCMEVRRRLFSEARLQFQQVRDGQPGKLYGSGSLGLIENPWPGGSTRDLLSRMIQDADAGGNFFGAVHQGGIYRLRPDWTTVVSANPRPGADINDYDTEIIGYVYQPGGPNSGRDSSAFRREQVIHWMPIPDPECRFLGMSWITPIAREIMADGAATTHKLRFFQNGATPNVIMQMDPNLQPDTFKRYVDMFRENEEGLDNAYKTLFTTAASVQVVGKDLQQIDFKVTQGAGETRIAMAAGVPPIVAGLSEGLQASTYSNYASARRHFADGTLHPLWGSACEAINTVLTGRGGDRLWYDPRFVSFLQEDQKDEAEIKQIESTTARTLIEAGYTPESVQNFIQSGDWSLLKHSGLVSVQLQEPGADAMGDAAPKPTPQLPPAKAGRADVLLDAMRSASPN